MSQLPIKKVVLKNKTYFFIIFFLIILSFGCYFGPCLRWPNLSTTTGHGGFPFGKLIQNGTLQNIPKSFSSSSGAAASASAPSVAGVVSLTGGMVSSVNMYDENLVVIYNRVPKTGSTSFINLAYDLCKKNKFHVLHINVTANMHVLSLSNQVEFVRNITAWNQIKPALYHGHMAYLDFSKFGVPTKPIYINLIRKPLDRLVSYYYFLRYGDNFRPNLVRKKAGDKMTFDECVEKKQPDCDPKNMWLQIPFFCGHSAECWQPGSSWALNQAKLNLVNNYFLVGVTEEMEDFIYLLELSLPRLFNGTLDHYMNSDKSHLRQTASKWEPTQKTINEITKSIIWRMESEFYEFALQQFHFLYKLKNTVRLQGKNVTQKYFYEKIRPK